MDLKRRIRGDEGTDLRLDEAQQSTRAINVKRVPHRACKLTITKSLMIYYFSTLMLLTITVNALSSASNTTRSQILYDFNPSQSFLPLVNKPSGLYGLVASYYPSKKFEEEEEGFIMQQSSSTPEATTQQPELTTTGALVVSSSSSSSSSSIEQTTTEAGQSGDDQRIPIDANRPQYLTHDQLTANTKEELINTTTTTTAKTPASSRAGMSKVASSFLTDVLAYAIRTKPTTPAAASQGTPEENKQKQASSPNSCPGTCRSIFTASLLCRNEVAAPCPYYFQRCCELEVSLNGTPVETSAPIPAPDADAHSTALSANLPQTQDATTVDYQKTPPPASPTISQPTATTTTTLAAPIATQQAAVAAAAGTTTEPLPVITSLGPNGTTGKPGVEVQQPNQHKLSDAKQDVLPKPSLDDAGHQRTPSADRLVPTDNGADAKATTTASQAFDSPLSTEDPTTNDNKSTSILSSAAGAVLVDLLGSWLSNSLTPSDAPEAAQSNASDPMSVAESSPMGHEHSLDAHAAADQGADSGSNSGEQQNDRRLGYELSFRQQPNGLDNTSAAVDSSGLMTSDGSNEQGGQDKCLGYCILPLFNMLCDSTYESSDCGPNRKCCISGANQDQSLATNEVTSSSTGNRQLCMGKCLRIYHLSLCTKPNEIQYDSPGCLPNYACCASVGVNLDDSAGPAESLISSSDPSGLMAEPSHKINIGDDQDLVSKEPALFASLVPPLPPAISNSLMGQQQQLYVQEKNMQQNSLGNDQYMAASGRQRPSTIMTPGESQASFAIQQIMQAPAMRPAVKATTTQSQGGFMSQLYQMFKPSSSSSSNKQQQRPQHQPIFRPQQASVQQVQHANPFLTQMYDPQMYQIHQMQQQQQQLMASRQNQLNLAMSASQPQQHHLMFPTQTGALVNQGQQTTAMIHPPIDISNSQQQANRMPSNYQQQYGGMNNNQALQKLNSHQPQFQPQQPPPPQHPAQIANTDNIKPSRTVMINSNPSLQQFKPHSASSVSIPTQMLINQQVQMSQARSKGQQKPGGGNLFALEPAQHQIDHQKAYQNFPQNNHPQNVQPQPVYDQQLMFGASDANLPVAPMQQKVSQSDQTVRSNSGYSQQQASKYYPTQVAQSGIRPAGSGHDLEQQTNRRPVGSVHSSSQSSRISGTGQEVPAATNNVQITSVPSPISRQQQRQQASNNKLASGSQQLSQAQKLVSGQKSGSGNSQARQQATKNELTPMKSVADPILAQSPSDLNVLHSNGPTLIADLQRIEEQIATNKRQQGGQTSIESPVHDHRRPASTDSDMGLADSKRVVVNQQQSAPTQLTGIVSMVDNNKLDVHPTHLDADDQLTDESSTTGNKQPVSSVEEAASTIESGSNKALSSASCGVPGGGRATSGRAKGRVMGGFDAKTDHWCWQAALMNNKNEYLCGGALIGAKWVLTAAHCVTHHLRSESQLFVRLGQTDLNNTQSNKNAKTIQVKTSYVHHNHNSLTLDNDIALLRLEEAIDFEDPKSNSICLICLPERKSQVEPGKCCTVTGYGFETEDGPAALRVRQTDLPIVADQECQNKTSQVLGRPFSLPASSFCAGGELGQDACHGDGGSPLSCLVDGYYELTGIVSWGYKCGSKDLPGLYSKVSTFVGWINQIVSVNN